MKNTRNILAENLKMLMTEKDIRQDKTRELTGVAQKTISNTLNSYTAASIDTIEGLANGFKVAPWALLVNKIKSSKDAHEIERVVRLYLSCNETGRNQINRTAEAESRYSSSES